MEENGVLLNEEVKEVEPLEETPVEEEVEGDSEESVPEVVAGEDEI